MRLWHYELLQYLPNEQLLGQWRELNSIFKKQDKHILINYVYEYEKVNLVEYTLLVVKEMNNRGLKITSFHNAYNYFKDMLCSCIFEESYIPNEFIDGFLSGENPFPQHHDYRYLLQCFYNLQEKYDRRQKGFSKERYNALEHFVEKQMFINNMEKISNDMAEFSNNMEESLNNMKGRK